MECLAGQEAYTGFLEDPQAIIEAEQYAEDQRNIDMLLYDDTGQQDTAAHAGHSVQETLQAPASQLLLSHATDSTNDNVGCGLVQYSSSDEDAA